MLIYRLMLLIRVLLCRRRWELEQVPWTAPGPCLCWSQSACVAWLTAETKCLTGLLVACVGWPRNSRASHSCMRSSAPGSSSAGAEQGSGLKAGDTPNTLFHERLAVPLTPTPHTQQEEGPNTPESGCGGEEGRAVSASLRSSHSVPQPGS